MSAPGEERNSEECCLERKVDHARGSVGGGEIRSSCQPTPQLPHLCPVDMNGKFDVEATHGESFNYLAEKSILHIFVRLFVGANDISSKRCRFIASLETYNRILIYYLHQKSNIDNYLKEKKNLAEKRDDN